MVIAVDGHSERKVAAENTTVELSTFDDCLLITLHGVDLGVDGDGEGEVAEKDATLTIDF